jgi:hypothetical protein
VVEEVNKTGCGKASAVREREASLAMDNTVIAALIGSGGSVPLAITALAPVLETRVDGRLNPMQPDMRDLNKTMTALEIDIALLKDRAGR